MKLSACLVSSDLTPLYFDFFPLVHRVWRELVGVRAVLALVAKEMPEALRPLEADVLLVPPIAGVESAFHAQAVRLLAPQIIGAPADEAVIISDIDMLPMSRDYFLGPLKDAAGDEFVVYRSEALKPSERQILMCYNAAAPGTWAEIFGSISDVGDLNRQIREWALSFTSDGGHGAPGWSADQELLFRGVASFDQKRVRRIKDAQTSFMRLDRGGMGPRLSPMQASLAKRHSYSDYHMKRPNAEFEALNEHIAQLVAHGAKQPWPIDRLLYDVDRKLRRVFG